MNHSIHSLKFHEQRGCGLGKDEQRERRKHVTNLCEDHWMFSWVSGYWVISKLNTEMMISRSDLEDKAWKDGLMRLKGWLSLNSCPLGTALVERKLGVGWLYRWVGWRGGTGTPHLYPEAPFLRLFLVIFSNKCPWCDLLNAVDNGRLVICRL